MSLPPLPSDWEPTRLSLQKYAQAISAAPRAGADPDPRWSHVSLHPVRTPGGIEAFTSAPVPLDEGAQLVSTFDVLAGSVVVAAGDDFETFVLADGPSPKSIGAAIEGLLRSHGATIDVDSDRYADDNTQRYTEAHAFAWFENTAWVTSVLDELNAGLDGETSGPHIWPHGFDVATEWFGTRVVDDEGSNAQIAVGFYPAGDPYFYANPWPFNDAWVNETPPHGAVWNTEGWFGVKLDATALTGKNDRGAVLDVARFVHAIAGPGFVGG